MSDTGTLASGLPSEAGLTRLEHLKFDVDEDGNIIIRTRGKLATQGLSRSGKITTVLLNTLTWSALPASSLTLRNTIAIQNRTGQDIRLNFDPLAPISDGWLLPDQYERSYPIAENVLIYAVSTVSSVSITVEELA